MKSFLQLFLLAAFGTSPAFAQTPSILWQFDGQMNESFGRSIASADLNLDGHPDIIVGAPGASNGSGRVVFYSGLDGSAFMSLHGGTQGDLLGADVCCLGDLNGDGYPEVAINAPGIFTAGVKAGVVYVVSGADGSVLWLIEGGEALHTYVFSMDSAGDVNQDGVTDLIIGFHMIHDFDGIAQVFSGADGSILYEIRGGTRWGQLGYSVAGAGDVDLDGFDDFIIGSNYSSLGGPSSGLATVYSGQDGSTLHQFPGENHHDQLGSCIDAGGDANGDGIPDFVIGAEGTDVLASYAGTVYVHSGLDGSLLWRVDAPYSQNHFGQHASFAGDMNGDGFDDVLIGDYKGGFSGGTSAWGPGYAWVHSGMDGSLLWRLEGDVDHDVFGVSVAAVGDVDGNGTDDIAVGATGEFNVRNGYVRIFGGTGSAFDLGLLTTTPPTGGSMAVSWAVGTTPGTNVTLFAGTGQGRGYLPGIGKLEILQPAAVDSNFANASGNARLNSWIPMSWVGMPLWLQAVDAFGQRSILNFFVIQ